MTTQAKLAVQLDFDPSGSLVLVFQRGKQARSYEITVKDEATLFDVLMIRARQRREQATASNNVVPISNGPAAAAGLG